MMDVELTENNVTPLCFLGIDRRSAGNEGVGLDERGTDTDVTCKKVMGYLPKTLSILLLRVPS